jgi:hypothetical protein
MGEYAFLAVYRSSAGMTPADLWVKGNGMLEAWLILGVEWVVFMVLAWYLEQVRVCVWGGGRVEKGRGWMFLCAIRVLAHNGRGVGGVHGARMVPGTGVLIP